MTASGIARWCRTASAARRRMPTTNCYAHAFGLEKKRSYGKLNGDDISGPFFIDNPGAQKLLSATCDEIMNPADRKVGDIIAIRTRKEPVHAVRVVQILP